MFWVGFTLKIVFLFGLSLNSKKKLEVLFATPRGRRRKKYLGNVIVNVAHACQNVRGLY